MRRALLLVLAALLLGGCGLIKTPHAGTVTVLITRDFGARTVASLSERVPARGRPADAATRAVTALQAASGAPGATSVDRIAAPPGSAWTLFVNGIPVTTPTAAVKVEAGDWLWWDLHAAVNGYAPRGVVGVFPQPFISGYGGKRLPTVLECASDVQAPCDTARGALNRIGIPGTYQVLGTGSGTDSLGIELGTYVDLNAEVVAALLDRGPGASGVFARFADGGRALELLRADGSVARRLTGSAGLVAATGDVIAKPNWLITGTDPSGVQTAALAFARGAAALGGHYAVAIDGQSVIPLPVGS